MPQGTNLWQVKAFIMQGQGCCGCAKQAWALNVFGVCCCTYCNVPDTHLGASETWMRVSFPRHSGRRSRSCNTASCQHDEQRALCASLVWLATQRACAGGRLLREGGTGRSCLTCNSSGKAGTCMLSRSRSCSYVLLHCQSGLPCTTSPREAEGMLRAAAVRSQNTRHPHGSAHS